MHIFTQFYTTNDETLRHFFLLMIVVDFAVNNSMH